MIDIDLFRRLLRYDEETGFLFWRERVPSMGFSERLCNTFNASFAGKRAGNVHKSRSMSPYIDRQIKVMGKSYGEHRVAWAIAYGEQPPDLIDHKDRNPLNNRLDNLRASSFFDNTKNASKYSNNASGAPGVTWNKWHHKWQAQSRMRGKTVHLGYFDGNDLDIAAMEVMEYWAENGFSEGHGKDRSVDLPNEYVRQQEEDARS